MRIAIPLNGGKLARHFGHCEEFALFDAEGEQAKVAECDRVPAPPHEPGLLPRYLKEQGADVIIADGMGRRARQLFSQAGIKVVVGAEGSEPRTIVAEYVNGDLSTGPNLCEH